MTFRTVVTQRRESGEFLVGHKMWGREATLDLDDSHLLFAVCMQRRTTNPIRQVARRTFRQRAIANSAAGEQPCAERDGLLPTVIAEVVSLS